MSQRIARRQYLVGYRIAFAGVLDGAPLGCAANSISALVVSDWFCPDQPLLSFDMASSQPTNTAANRQIVHNCRCSRLSTTGRRSIGYCTTRPSRSMKRLVHRTGQDSIVRIGHSSEKSCPSTYRMCYMMKARPIPASRYCLTWTLSGREGVAYHLWDKWTRHVRGSVLLLPLMCGGKDMARRIVFEGSG